jgi:hypothetical protein
VRGRGSSVELATAASSALARRRDLVELLRAQPTATLLFPLPAIAAVTLDGGVDSVWTPLVATTVSVPATLGLPWLSLACALIAATGQAAAAWVNQGDRSSDRLVEIRSSVGPAPSAPASGSRWRS